MHLAAGVRHLYGRACVCVCVRVCVHACVYIVSIMLCIAIKETHSQGVPCVLQLATFPFPQASETFKRHRGE